MSLQGEYEHEEGDIDAMPIQITHVQGPQTGPETVRYLSGHVGQLACFYTGFEWQSLGQEPFQRDCERIWAVIAGGEDKIWVWDSAGYSEKNLREISESYKWIMRVPETLSEAKEVLENADTKKMKSTSLNGYRLFSTEVEYGGVKQRWIVVFSEKAFEERRKRWRRR